MEGGELREEGEEGAEAAQEGDDRQGRLRHLQLVRQRMACCHCRAADDHPGDMPI